VLEEKFFLKEVQSVITSIINYVLDLIKLYLDLGVEPYITWGHQIFELSQRLGLINLDFSCIKFEFQGRVLT